MFKKSLIYYIKHFIFIAVFFLLFIATYNIKALSKIENTYCTNNKIAYLTFDDGPSKITEEILDILQENNIKATFFIVGPIFKEDLQFTERAIKEGHTIGNHTYDHDYKDVYISQKAFWQNFSKAQYLIESLTNKPCKTFRFPGGSFNSTVKRANGKEFISNIINEMKVQGINYYDWNVDSCDGLNDFTPSSVLYNNVINGIKDKDKVIILMHDSKNKKTTVESLPKIITYLKNKGYTFKALDQE